MTMTSRRSAGASAICTLVRGVSVPVICRGKDDVRWENLDLRFAWDAELLDPGHEPVPSEVIKRFGRLPDVGISQAVVSDRYDVKHRPGGTSPSQFTCLRAASHSSAPIPFQVICIITAAEHLLSPGRQHHALAGLTITTSHPRCWITV